jgi:hypothetical protein
MTLTVGRVPFRAIVRLVFIVRFFLIDCGCCCCVVVAESCKGSARRRIRLLHLVQIGLLR